MSSKATSARSIAPEKSRSALLIIDLVSDFLFPDGARVFKAALPVAKRIALLKKRARAAGVPVIYVNDNYGRWRSSLPEVLAYCAGATEWSAEILRIIGPAADDHCILKPKHSGFYATALDTLLQYIGAEDLVITGVSGNQCVLFTANDAYVRDYKLRIPRDCIASPSAHATKFALQYFTTVLGADVRSSTRLRFQRKLPARSTTKL